MALLEVKGIEIVLCNVYNVRYVEAQGGLKWL